MVPAGSGEEAVSQQAPYLWQSYTLMASSAAWWLSSLPDSHCFQKSAAAVVQDAIPVICAILCLDKTLSEPLQLASSSLQGHSGQAGTGRQGQRAGAGTATGMQGRGSGSSALQAGRQSSADAVSSGSTSQLADSSAGAGPPVPAAAAAADVLPAAHEQSVQIAAAAAVKAWSALYLNDTGEGGAR